MALKTGRAAILTNGRWSPGFEQIKWVDRALNREGLPQIVYAVWDEPDDDWQTARFGSVVLRGDPLLQYCLWYHGLTASESGEWDAFVGALTPDAELGQALREFRFSDEPASRGPDECLASEPRAAILQGLKERR